MKDLVDLQDHVEVVELDPDEILYERQELDRGIFFVEEGILVSTHPLSERIAMVRMTASHANPFLSENREGYNSDSDSHRKRRLLASSKQRNLE